MPAFRNRSIFSLAAVATLATIMGGVGPVAPSTASGQQPEPAPIALKPGDPAPALSIDSWFKGEPVTGFEKGRVYVIEFWATWCSPCIEAIPHLSHLQSTFKDKVRFIGVSTDQNRDKADKFVVAQGDAMAYAVGHDADRSMSTEWMAAAGRNGIPCSFVVDGQGRVAWIGHPKLGLDHVLVRIVDGTFDPVAWAAAEASFNKLMQRAISAARASDFDAAYAALDEAGRIDPYFATESALARFQLVLYIKGDFEEASRLGATMIDGSHKDNAAALMRIGSTLVDGPGPSQRDHAVALKAFERAVELEAGRSAATLVRLASVYWSRGDVAKAVEAQRKALAAATTDTLRAQIQTRLDEYARGK